MQMAWLSSATARYLKILTRLCRIFGQWKPRYRSSFGSN